MSDKAALVSLVYSRYRAHTSNGNVISPAFKRLLLAESELAFLISPSKWLLLHLSPSDLRSKHILLVIKN